MGRGISTLDLQDFQRTGHLAYQPLPGGEQAILEPWRMAVSYLYSVYGKELLNLPSPVIQQVHPSQVELMLQMMDKKINSPLTSSVGRLFDAVYGILGFGSRITFEGQTGIFLESIADTNVKERYEYAIEKGEDGFQVVTKFILKTDSGRFTENCFVECYFRKIPQYSNRLFNRDGSSFTGEIWQ